MKKSEAIHLRGVIESAAQSLDDHTALSAVMLYPEWVEGASYAVDVRVRQNGGLYRCLQTHNALPGWEPENAPALWDRINETNAGTLEDPIPYNGNMALEVGKYYIQGGVIYCCTRDTGNPVYNDLKDLIGLYVEAC